MFAFIPMAPWEIREAKRDFLIKVVPDQAGEAVTTFRALVESIDPPSGASVTSEERFPPKSTTE